MTTGLFNQCRSNKMELGCDIQLLAQLLNPNRNDVSDEEDNVTTPGNSYLTPADVSSKPNEPKVNDDEEEKKILDPDAFECETTDYNPKNAWKKTPVWDVSYRQQVTASDVFLQMGGKNPSTASCENMIIKIHLPGESRHNIDVKVLEARLEINSPRFFLDIPLPHPVDPQRGDAKYDTETEQLTLTLLMNREFDYINF